MRKDVIDMAQSAIWLGLGDEVEVFAPGANVARTILSGPGSRSGPCRTRPTHPAKGCRISSRFEGLVFAWPGRPC